MVTTTRDPRSQVREAAAIKILFGQAAKRTQKLIVDLDGLDLTTRRAVFDVLVAAIDVVKPTLKYVDQEVKITVQVTNPQYPATKMDQEKTIRGIKLAEGVYLQRNGEFFRLEEEGQTPAIIRFMLEHNDPIPVMLEILANLAEVYGLALQKMEERERNLTVVQEKLAEALKPFQAS